MTPEEVLLLLLIPSRGSYWQNVTGGVDNKEDIGKAAARELKEETALEAKNGELIDLNFQFDFEGRNIFQNDSISGISVSGIFGELDLSKVNSDYTNDQSSTGAKTHGDFSKAIFDIYHIQILYLSNSDTSSIAPAK